MRFKSRGLRKLFILAVCYAAAGIAALSGLAYTNHLRAENYGRAIQSGYERAFTELAVNMRDIDSWLQKCVYANSPAVVGSVCANLYAKAMAAQMSLSELPFSTLELENTASFINRVGDYAFAISKKSASGIAYSDEELSNLTALSDTASILSGNLLQLQSDINSGAISIGQLAASRMSGADQQAAAQTLGGSFQQMENEFPEIPALIYDGPFSEHLDKPSPMFLEGKGEVTQEDARKTAADFLGVSADSLSEARTCDGKLPSFCFTASPDGSETNVEVTRQGGAVVNMMCSRPSDSSGISNDQAVSNALDFLSKHGYDSMKESYWMVKNNIAVINFAYVQADVICYPDLVKVSVALDNGDIVGFESQGYIMSHCPRQLPADAVSEEQARTKVSDQLSVLSHAMALIPTDGKSEVLCHEFKCENGDDRHYIVYVNASTGEQERILILLEDASGILTM